MRATRLSGPGTASRADRRAEPSASATTSATRDANGSRRLGAALAAALAATAATAVSATPAAALQTGAGETVVDATGLDATATDDTPAGEAVADTTAVDALRCWRRVDRHAVFVGERFTMTVTCRTVETQAARTRLDEDALEPATLDAAPFEVLAGERFDDVLTGPYRFSQRAYTLRLIAESGFGEDVEIPALDLPYRIERRVGDDPALPGRELIYILPPEAVRVLSLVPEGAEDIRDLPPAGFGDAQAGELRADLLGLLSALFGVAALGLVALGALRVARDRKGGAAVTEKRLSPARAARRALEELVRVRGAAAGNGWTRDTAGRALTALRIASAVALSRPVTQSPIAAGEAPRDGQLRVRHGLLGRRTAAMSSAVTAADFRLAETPAAADLHRAMSLLTAARYGRGDETMGPGVEPAALTRAVDAGIGHVGRLRWRVLAPVRRVGRWTEGARQAWTRLTRQASWRR